MKMCSLNCHKVHDSIGAYAYNQEGKNGISEVDYHGVVHETEVLFWIDTENETVASVGKLVNRIKSQFNKRASKKNWGDVNWSYTYGHGCIGLVAYVRIQCEIVPDFKDHYSFRFAEFGEWYDPSIQKIIL